MKRFSLIGLRTFVVPSLGAPVQAADPVVGRL